MNVLTILLLKSYKRRPNNVVNLSYFFTLLIFYTFCVWEYYWEPRFPINTNKYTFFANWHYYFSKYQAALKFKNTLCF